MGAYPEKIKDILRQKYGDKLSEEELKRFAGAIYATRMGEVQARAAEKRLSLGSDYRKATPPSRSYDVSLDEIWAGDIDGLISRLIDKHKGGFAR